MDPNKDVRDVGVRDQGVMFGHARGACHWRNDQCCKIVDETVARCCENNASDSFVEDLGIDSKMLNDQDCEVLLRSNKQNPHVELAHAVQTLVRKPLSGLMSWPKSIDRSWVGVPLVHCQSLLPSMALLVPPITVYDKFKVLLRVFSLFPPASKALH